MSAQTTEPDVKTDKPLKKGPIYDILDDRIFERGLDYDPAQEEERKDTPSLSTLGEERYLQEDRSGKTAIFNFSAVSEKEKQEAIGVSSTPTFKVGLRSLAASLDIGIAELVRRAIFAVARDPSIVQTPFVDEMENEFQGTTHSRGGADRNQGKRPSERSPEVS